MSLTTAMPSFLPLPVTITRSNPAERFLAKRAAAAALEPPKQRPKMAAQIEREAKSLTPDRDCKSHQQLQQHVVRRLSAPKGTVGNSSVDKKEVVCKDAVNNGHKTPGRTRRSRTTTSTKTSGSHHKESGGLKTAETRLPTSATRRATTTEAASNSSSTTSRPPTTTTTSGHEDTSTSTTAQSFRPDVLQGTEVEQLRAKEEENKLLKLHLAHNAKGFQALAVIVERLNALNQAKKRRDETSLITSQLDDNNIIANHEVDHDDGQEAADVTVVVDLDEDREEREQVQHLHHLVTEARGELQRESEATRKLIASYERRIEDMRNEQAQAVARHESVVSELASAHIRDLTLQDNRHEAELSSCSKRFQEQLQTMEEKWEERMITVLEEKSEKVNGLDERNKLNQQQFEENKKCLEERIRSLTEELKNQEVSVRVRRKDEQRLSCLLRSLEETKAELESHKAVLELKTEEMNALRVQKSDLEAKLEDFERVQADLAKTRLQLEDMQAQLFSKQQLERTLSAENRELNVSVSRERHENKRLSQQNEELQWRIREQFETSAHSSVANESDVSSFTSLVDTSSPYMACEGRQERRMANRRTAKSFSEADTQQRSLPFMPLKSPTTSLRSPSFLSPAALKTPIDDDEEEEEDEDEEDEVMKRLVRKSDSIAWSIEADDKREIDEDDVTNISSTQPLSLESTSDSAVVSVSSSCLQ